jgi:hypothetical protein
MESCHDEQKHNYKVSCLLFILLYWLLTSVYAKHLISNFELEKGDNRTKF